MMSKVKNVFKGNAGFTLIELLIVIVIIGILAAIAIPNIVGLTGTADKGAMESNMRTLLTDIESYRARHGDYPEEDGDYFAETDPDKNDNNGNPGFDTNALNEIVDEAEDNGDTGEDAITYDLPTDGGFTLAATFNFGDGFETLYISSTEGYSTTSPE